VGVGVRAGPRNNRGLRNVFVGGRAGEGSNVNDDRSFNVMVGYASGFSNQGNANVFLGYQAGQNAAGSNRLYIENSSSNSPLIYGEFDNNLLRINGTLNINNAFSFPTTDGSAGQQLQTDGAGNVAWVDPSVSPDDQTIDVLNLNGTTLEISLAGDNQPTRTIDLSALVEPVGTIKMWHTETPPPGWLICDGNLVPNAYPALQNLLPNQRLPDLRGRVPIGSGTGTALTSSDYTVGQSGGQEKRAITLDQMPEHNHGVFFRTGTESGSSSNAYSELQSPPNGQSSLSSVNTTSAGQDENEIEPFNVVQPYYVVNFIIKAQ
ncbi:MAG: tail fiber protein, partial [Bacteroidota bacterium]